MPKRILGAVPCAVAVLLLAFGMVRAAASRFELRREAIYRECKAEQARLGLNRQAVYKQYPTPEITLCRAVRVLPGSAAEVAVSGKFAPGTKFLFENDALEVVKESLAGSDYRATVQAPRGAAPAVAYLHAFTPVSGAFKRCLAVYVGGGYEWDLKAVNGWRIKFRTLHEGFAAGAVEPPEGLLRAEFYRGAETAPFQLLLATLPLGNSAQGNYFVRIIRGSDSVSQERQKLLLAADPELAARLRENAEAYRKTLQADQKKQRAAWEQSKDKVEAETARATRAFEAAAAPLQAEMKKVAEKMQDPKLSQAEQGKLIARIGELSAQMQEVSRKMEQSLQAVRPVREPTQLERETQEFGCEEMSFQVKGGQVEGTARCGEKVGERGNLKLKGTMKFVGP